MHNSQKEYELYSSLLLKSTFDEINNSSISTTNEENSTKNEFSFFNFDNSFYNENNQIEEIQKLNSKNIKNDNKNLKNHFNEIQKDFNLEEKYIKNLSNKDQLTVSQIEDIIPKLKGKFFQLMNGKNSNYLMSELIQNASKKQKLIILSEIYNQIDILAINEYGSHPLQTLIEKASSKDEIIMIINAISSRNKLIKIAKNSNGTYVIQKIISYFNENYRNKINKIILKHFTELCYNMYGVCIIKKFINTCENEQILFSLFSLFIQNFVNISENQFGNYAIQIFIEKIANNEKLFSVFEQTITFNFIRLSINRFGSRVIECFIEKLNRRKKMQLFNCILEMGYLNQIITNKYGKYVICKLFNGYENLYNINIRNMISNMNIDINNDNNIYIF